MQFRTNSRLVLGLLMTDIRTYASILWRPRTDVALKIALEDALDRKIEKWAYPSSSMTVFARRGLTSTQFRRAVAKFILEKVEDQASLVEEIMEIATVSFSLLLFTSLSPMASFELQKQQYEKRKQDVSVGEEILCKRKQRHEGQKHSSLSGISIISAHLSSPLPDTESFFTQVSRDWKIHKWKAMKPEIFVLLSVKKSYAKALNYCIYPLSDISTKYDQKISSYMHKLAEKVEAQMYLHFSCPKDFISIIALRPTFKLAWSTNRIYEGAEKWVLPHCVNEKLAKRTQ